MSDAADRGELPEGWAECTVGDVAEVVGGGTPKASEPDNFAADGHPWITPADLSTHQETYISRGRRGLSAKGLRGSSATLVPPGTVLMSSRAPIGYVAVAANELCTNQGFKSFRCRPVVLPEFVYHWLRFKRDDIERMGSGSTFLEVSGSKCKEIPVVVPPLAEQRRIVAAVDRVLGRVADARARLDRVPGTVRRFRQAVLAAACSGRLTEDWRASAPKHAPDITHGPNSVGQRPSGKRRAGRLWGGGEVPELTDEERNGVPSSWRWVKVGELGNGMDEAVQVGPMSMQSKDFADTGTPVLNVGCIQWGWFDKSKLDHMPPDKAAAFGRYRIASGDILFTRSGTVGRCAVAGPDEHDYLMTFHLLRVRVSRDKVLNDYLCHVFRGAEHIRRQMEDAAIGSTRAGFNTGLLAGLDVPLPPLPEQREIVRRVAGLFALADGVENHVRAARRRADALAQAVLAKAFRGELVPTEADLARRDGRGYEPAADLLARVRAAVPAPPAKKARRKSP